MNFQIFKLVLKKGKGTRNQIANIRWIIEKAREFQNIYVCLFDYTKKNLHDPEHHDDVITHLELDILECEVQ